MASTLKTLHYSTPIFTNAHLNRKQAIRLFKAGFSPAQIAVAFPEVFELAPDGLLGQRYDSVYRDSGLKETRYTIAEHVVDAMIVGRQQ